MDTKRQERRRHVILLCVCTLLLAVTEDAVSEIQEGQKTIPPAGQGTKHTDTLSAHHDGDEQQTKQDQGHATGGKRLQKSTQDVDPPPGETKEALPSDSPEAQKEEEPTLKSPLPPDGDSNTLSAQQRNVPMDAQPVDHQQEAADESVDMVARPDTPSSHEKVTLDAPPEDKLPGPKTGTEPETPRTGDGSNSVDSQPRPSEPQEETKEGSKGDPTKPHPSSDPGQDKVVDTQESKSQHREETLKQETAPEKEETAPEEVKKEGEKTVEAAGEEPEAPKREQDLPSFDEWKEKIIAEQAEQAKQAKQEKMEAQASQQVNKKKVNYASVTCGAKLLVANPEAKNAASILNENKDQYMIQPCQAKKWFVVELCEPVAIQSLEIANLELFSSLPESFIVSTSERYPTKEWKNLGTFRARDERAVQSFPIMEEDMFSKYIKVEPLTHYGDEHYCPLTLVRVYGTTVVEDYEDSDHMDQSPEEDPTLDESASIDEPSNLFTSATDTVISLVKTVLSPGEKEKEVKIDDIVKMNTTTRNKSLPNVTHGLVADGDQAAPCTPGVSSGESPSSGADGGPSVTQLPATPDASDHPPIVTLIESHPHTVRLGELIYQCNFCQDLHQPACYSDRSHICGYYRAANFVLGTSCATKIGPKTKEEMEKRPGQIFPQKSKPSSDKSLPTNGKEDPSDTETGAAKPAKGSKEEYRAGKDQPKMVQPGTRVTSSPVLEPSVQGTSATHTQQGQGNEIESPSLQPSLSISTTGSGGTQTTAPLAEQDITLTPSCDPTQADCSTMGPDIVQIRPTTTEEAMMRTVPKQAETVQVGDEAKAGGDDDKKTAEPPPEASKTIQVEPPPQGPGSENGSAGMTNGGMEKVIYADSPGSHDSEYLELEMVPPPDEGEAIHKLSSGRRENAFMRLKNRIKALELNLTLSSRYLEELSKRYRREMEDMYLSLNKTILKLTNTSRTAEQRDVRQQANITNLTKRIKHLTEQVDSLKESLGHIHTQVIERHLFLMMVEFVLFLLIVTWLLNRVQQPQINRVSSQPTLTTTASTSAPQQVPPTQQSKPPDKQKKVVHKHHRRRNSIDATPPRPKLTTAVPGQRSKDDIHLRLSGSESRFGSDVLDAVAVASSSSDFKEIAPKKKKVPTATLR